MSQTFILRKGDDVRADNAKRAIDKLRQTMDVELVVGEYHPKHSDEQRRTFYGWCDLFAKIQREAGHPCCEEAVHDEVLGHIFGWEDIGFGRKRPARTLTRPTRLNKTSMMEVMTRFEVWASEHGVMLPIPNDGNEWKAKAA